MANGKFYVIIRGPLGCGKSTISETLSKDLKGKHIEVDRVLDENQLTEDKEDGYISQKSFIKANEIIAKRSNELIRNGTPVVYDGNFYWESQIKDLIEKLDYPHYVFTLKCPLDICIDRDGRRDNPHGEEATRAVFDKSNSFDIGININVVQDINKVIKEIKSHIKI